MFLSLKKKIFFGNIVETKGSKTEYLPLDFVSCIPYKWESIFLGVEHGGFGWRVAVATGLEISN